MAKRAEHSARIAAYLAGRLTPEETAKFESAVAHDPHLAREVEAMRGVTGWIESVVQEAPRAEYRLSAARRAAILAEARRDIVPFPERVSASRGARAARRRHSIRRALSALAASAAIILSGLLGLGTGKERYEAELADMQASLLYVAPSADVSYPEPVRLYPPNYSLNHSDEPLPGEIQTAGSRAHGATVIAAYKANVPPPYFGLPGPRPWYLSGRSVPDAP